MPVVLDYQNPQAADGATLKAEGIEGVMRYTYNLTADECQDLWAHSIKVGLVFEHLTSDIAGDYNAGQANGRRSRDLAAALHFPAGVPVYWAVDERLTDAQRAVALEYGRGFRDGCGASRCYGEGKLINQAVEAGLCDLGWMPATWGPCSYLALTQDVPTQSPIPSTDSNQTHDPNWGGYLPGGDVTLDELKKALKDDPELRDLLAGVASIGATTALDPRTAGSSGARIVDETVKGVGTGHGGAGAPASGTYTFSPK